MDHPFNTVVRWPHGSPAERIPAVIPDFPDETIRLGVERLEGAAALLMAMQRHWDDRDRETRLALTIAANREVWHDILNALADARLSLPIEVQQNLLILAVCAEGRLDECAADPRVEKLGALLALTRNLASSLRVWKAAA